MAENGPRMRRSPLRPVRTAVRSEETANIDAGLNQSFTSLDEHVIRMRTLRSSPRRRSSILSTGEISLLGSPGISPDSSFDTSFGSDVSSLSNFSSLSSSTPIVNPRAPMDKIRKRLQMFPPDDMDANFPKTVSPPKRKKASVTAGATPELDQRLSALSKDQLISLFETLAQNDPETKLEIERLLPVPDVSPLLENLEYFRHNIYKSLPHSQWGSSRDAFCYRRVATHLANFKGACISQGKQLQEARSWEASVEYCLKATEYVERLPDWDNTAHNKSKQQCFRGLAAQCKAAIKHSSFAKPKYQEIKAQVVEVMKVTSDFMSCLDQIDKKIQKIK